MEQQLARFRSLLFQQTADHERIDTRRTLERTTACDIQEASAVRL